MIARVLAVTVVVLGSLFAVPKAEAQRGRDSVECSSNDYRYTRCDVPWREARLARQISGSQCVRGQTWGLDRRGIWVDRGCAGVFVEAGRGDGPGPGYPGGGGGGGWRPGPGWDTDIRFRCDSDDFRYRLCQVDVGRGGRVYVARQISGTRCVEGRNWGWNRAGVWVDQGCAAEFTVERRWRD